jgi:hypothetical protein
VLSGEVKFTIETQQPFTARKARWYKPFQTWFEYDDRPAAGVVFDTNISGSRCSTLSKPPAIPGFGLSGEVQPRILASGARQQTACHLRRGGRRHRRRKLKGTIRIVQTIAAAISFTDTTRKCRRSIPEQGRTIPKAPNTGSLEGQIRYPIEGGRRHRREGDVVCVRVHLARTALVGRAPAGWPERLPDIAYMFDAHRAPSVRSLAPGGR